MKGQAWNVVETLKQHDHGPLELTRRTRVCVWDDLVDVPVAIPMRVPSAEMSRHKARMGQPRQQQTQEEEMDIGASYASAPAPKQPTHDLLGSPTHELPNPNRFDLTREEQAGGDISYFHSSDDPISTTYPSAGSPKPSTSFDAKDARNSLATSSLHAVPTRPSVKNYKQSRFSFDFSSMRTSGGGGKGGSTSHHPGGNMRRQRSLSTRSGTGRPGTGPSMIYEGDDLEGDLGYAAASDMEANKRKVIVERLETVKSKKPVFTWC